MADLEEEQGQSSASGSPTDIDSNVDSSTTDSDGASSTQDDNEPKTSLDALTEALEGDGEESGGGDAAGDVSGQGAEAEGGEPSAKDKAAEGEGAGDAAAEGDKPTVEELTKPLPEDAKAETRERFDKLATSYKELATERDTANQKMSVMQQDIDDFAGFIKSSGASVQEFNELIDFSANLKSGNFDAAMQYLDKQRSAIAGYVATPVEGVDQLADFPDLKEKVGTMALPLESALEIAAARRNKAVQDQAANQASAEKDGAEKFQQAVTKGTNAITALAGQWRQNDPHYAAKHNQVMAQAKIFAETVHPDKWATAMTQYYDTLKDVKVTKPPVKKETRPLRPGGGGTGDAIPKSSLEAFDEAIG